jgi:hypothetical protein
VPGTSGALGGRPCLWQLRLAALKRATHGTFNLQGWSILIVKDNPIVVMDITLALEHTGAALNDHEHAQARSRARGARWAVGRHA